MGGAGVVLGASSTCVIGYPDSSDSVTDPVARLCGGGMAGFVVDPGALLYAADGVTAACDQVTDCAVDDWAPNGEHTGCGHLKDAVDDFCERWNIGVGSLLKDGQAFGQALRDTASDYSKIDAGAAALFRTIGGQR